VRRKYVRVTQFGSSSRRVQATRRSTYNTAAGTGIFLSPLIFLVLTIVSAYSGPYQVRSGEDFFMHEAPVQGLGFTILFALPLAWGFVVVTLRMLMPEVHPEMASEEEDFDPEQ
jgi:hypothetical protein